MLSVEGSLVYWEGSDRAALSQYKDLSCVQFAYVYVRVTMPSAQQQQSMPLKYLVFPLFVWNSSGVHARRYDQRAMMCGSPRV